MIGAMNKIFILFLILLLFSCKDSATDKIARLVEEWEGKEITFPKQSCYKVIGDTTSQRLKQNSNYSIVTYVDSMGCMSCKLKLHVWASLIQQLDSITNSSIPVRFFLHTNDLKRMRNVLKQYNFNYPVYIDEKDSFNILNQFPSEMMFQTFLLDKDNRVVAIGNPVNNSKIKDLYLSIISGKELKPMKLEQSLTTVLLSDNEIDLKQFSWRDRQEIEVEITNTGENPLVIYEAITSCGCMTVEYDRQPINPNKTIALKISYKAEHPEHFDKTITIHCNAENSPLILKISGNAE